MPLSWRAEEAMEVESPQPAMDSEVRGPTTGVQRLRLSGTTGTGTVGAGVRPGGAATAAA